MSQDRLIPYVDTGYRNAALYTVSPLRYAFPEWTACQHVSEPFDYQGVNSAVMTGSVICAEPGSYQTGMDEPVWRKLAAYIREVERIRDELREVIFTGEYCDTLYASAAPVRRSSAGQKGPELRGEVMLPGGGAPAAADEGSLHYRTHRSWDGSRCALVVANGGDRSDRYAFRFEGGGEGESFVLYEPFAAPRIIQPEETLEIGAYGLHIILRVLPHRA